MRTLPSPPRRSLDVPITEDGRAKIAHLSMYTVFWGHSGEELGIWGGGRALESRLSRADVVLVGGGSAEGHEKSLPCSGISKCKLLEKLVCPGTALLWGETRSVGRDKG